MGLGFGSFGICTGCLGCSIGCFDVCSPALVQNHPPRSARPNFSSLQKRLASYHTSLNRLPLIHINPKDQDLSLDPVPRGMRPHPLRHGRLLALVVQAEAWFSDYDFRA